MKRRKVSILPSVTDLAYYVSPIGPIIMVLTSFNSLSLFLYIVGDQVSPPDS